MRDAVNILIGGGDGLNELVYAPERNTELRVHALGFGELRGLQLDADERVQKLRRRGPLRVLFELRDNGGSDLACRLDG